MGWFNPAAPFPSMFAILFFEMGGLIHPQKGKVSGFLWYYLELYYRLW